MSNRTLPVQCPSCARELHVVRLGCDHCDTVVQGCYALPVLTRLSQGDRSLILNLVKSSGNLKDLARLYGVSYPTVRNRLDALIEKIGEIEADKEQDET